MKRRKLFQKERVARYDYVVSKEQPLSYVSEAFQKALVNIEYANIDGRFKVLQFTSSLAGAGKTTFISNFAYLLGKKEKKVVIVDLDLRKPKINRIYGVPNEGGLTEYLTGKIEYKDLIQYSSELMTHFIVSGERTTAVVNVLEANKLKELIARLREEFDYVILDSPPVIAVSDALYIAKLADTVIFVVAQNEAKRAVINEAINTLRNNKVHILGTVLTQVDTNDTDMYSYSYGYVGKSNYTSK